jgi:hypothetical protein
MGRRLSARVLRWLKRVTFLGPFELSTHTHKAEERTVFEIKMSGTPVEFFNSSPQLVISPTLVGNSSVSERVIVDDRRIYPYFEIFGENFIGSHSILDIKLEASSYSAASVLANYANVRSNLAFFKVLTRSNQTLKIKGCSFSCVSSGGTDDDFHNVLYSCVGNCYRYWDLFSYLADKAVGPNEAIQRFEMHSSSRLP